MTQPQALTHYFPTEVEIAVLQPHFLADGLIELERQGLGTVEDLDLLREKLDSARGEGELRDGITPAFAAAALVGLCTATLPALDELGAAADGDARGIAFGALPQQIASLVLNGVAA